MLKSRMNSLLTPLATAVAGDVADGGVRGRYQDFSVEGRPRSGPPITPTGTRKDGARLPDANTFQVTLAPARGQQTWHCQSTPTTAVGLLSQLPGTRRLGRFAAPEFRFEGVDPMRELGQHLGERLTALFGVPTPAVPDPALQERLAAGGLFDELEALRWGLNPYLPKAAFVPPASEVARAFERSQAFKRLEPHVSERLRSADQPDFESLVEAHLSEVDEKQPGSLLIEVEVDRARVPTPDQFRELLERAARIVQINLEANPLSPGPA